LENAAETVLIMFGTIKAGAILVPLSIMASAEALAGMMRDCKARAVFCCAPAHAGLTGALQTVTSLIDDGRIAVGFSAAGWTDYARFAGLDDEPPAVEIDPDDPINIIYSSGTTGAPKGVVHTHRARFIWACLKCIDDGTNQSSVNLITTPLYHNGALLFVVK